MVSKASPVAARTKCGTEPKPDRAEAPGAFRVGGHQQARDGADEQQHPPGRSAGRSASAVSTSHRPTTTNVSVITHRSVAPIAASALTVSATGSNRGCRSAATVHPLTSRTGAAAADTTPHHGTSRTTPP